MFGYDFIVDEVFKVWLIEVNTNPCLEESSKLLQALIPRMIDDALKLTVDVVFPRKKKESLINIQVTTSPTQSEKNYKVLEYPDNENLWELICDFPIVKNSFHANPNGKHRDYMGSTWASLGPEL